MIARKTFCVNCFASISPCLLFPAPAGPRMSFILGFDSEPLRSRFGRLIRAVGNFIALNIIGLCEVVAITISIAVDYLHLTHFTWWGLIWYGLYVCTTFFDRRDASGKSLRTISGRFWASAVATCSTILVGVIGLSLMQCEMLEDSVTEYGMSGFILGNFAVHYYPCLRLFCDSPLIFSRGARESTYEYFRQAAFGMVPLLVYVSWARTERVYGCHVSSLGVLLGTLLVFPLVFFIWWWRFIRS